MSVLLGEVLARRVSLQRKKCCQQIIGLNEESYRDVSISSRCPRYGGVAVPPSVVVRCYRRGRCAYLDSLAHFPYSRSECFNLLLLLRRSCLQVGNCALLLLYLAVLL